MIVIDTSALMAVLLNEELAPARAVVLESTSILAMSAGTVAEAKIVAARRQLGSAMDDLIDGLGIDIMPVIRQTARRVAQAYDQWGKGRHPAGLNVGDCFAYALAKELGCPLLVVGPDFPQPDLRSALR